MTVPGEGPVGHALPVAQAAIDRARFTCAGSGGPFGPMDFNFYQ